MEDEKDWSKATDNEMAEITDKQIIKEDDRSTDMLGFEAYLKSVYGERLFDAETQTNKVFKRHMKIGVNPEKIGILRDKETFTDMRMFQREGIIQQSFGQDMN